MAYGILPWHALEQAEKDGCVVLKNRGKINAISIDMRVKRLLKLRPEVQMLVMRDDGSIDMDLYEEFEPINGAWLLPSNGAFLAETVEELYKKVGFVGRLTSRSSWARCGVTCLGGPDELDRADEEYSGSLMFHISTFNTSVVLRPGDAPAQLFIAQTSLAPVPCPGSDKIEQPIVSGSQVRSSQPNVTGFPLTLDARIRLYNGGLLDPSQDVSKHFKDVDIKNGFAVNPSMFYLAASKERVKIPPEYAGHLPSMKYESMDGPFQRFHSNAPYVAPFPCFEGSITFECGPLTHGVIHEGMPLPPLELVPLVTPYHHREELTSRYNGQREACTSKGEQLLLFSDMGVYHEHEHTKKGRRR